ncbi:hypothetical protein HPB48_021023 [Haemaphysalis longicornis]|uniref:Transposase n=1 Tax=Haemaphysalis longicornis TaxID=44386 RepID=A0A9J6GBI3_HAELO|nr:hypothetical protein HPB48_021023 [Haemaphysalis longicornis]
MVQNLKEAHKNDSPRERLCSILLDGMSILKACDLDLSTRRLIGYVDLGNSQQPGLAAPWKMPFGYFLNAGLSGEVLKNLVVEAIRNVHECGLTVVAVVCDCLGANVAMAKLLGCRVHERAFDDLKTHFPNPLDAQQDIFLVFDACHGLKLLRNLLGDKGALLSSTYGVIEWKYVVRLHELQEKEGLRAANKLTRAHVEYYRQVMKVKLAAQTFSSSVSKAVVFASELRLPEWGRLQWHSAVYCCY